MLGYLIRQARFQYLRQVPHMLDASLGAEGYESARKDMLAASKLFEPFIIRMGIVTPEEYDRVYEQMQLEVLFAPIGKFPRIK